MSVENILLTSKHVCICQPHQFTPSKMSELCYLTDGAVELDIKQLDYTTKNFCGMVITDITKLENPTDHNTLLYLTGDIREILQDLLVNDVFKQEKFKQVFIIRDLSYNFQDEQNISLKLINSGQVPLNIHGVGVFIRDCFDHSENDYFAQISREHKFQNLTESNKPNNAFRTGIYITKVVKEEESMYYKLLRCSSNFAGPTDNVRKTDEYVMNIANQFGKDFFLDQSAELNHVLAQIYWNHVAENGLEKKAVIKSHSDKTKDMPRNGLMGFCTFYKDYFGGKFTDPQLAKISRSKTDPFDFCYKQGNSVLTRLRFVLKSDIVDNLENVEDTKDKKNAKNTMVKKFDIVLYPNSLFLMSLSGNRLYTHEIVASPIPIAHLPTRMGYVIRCSKTTSCYTNDSAHILVTGDKGDDQCMKKMEPSTKETATAIKQIYFLENSTSQLVSYPTILCSLNSGDYLPPIC